MRLYKFFLLSLILLSVNAVANDQISGVWKHTQKSAWLEIEFESDLGSLSVKRHDNNLKAAGLNVIKDITTDLNQSSQWIGKMYSAAENGYVGIVLILINPTTLSIYEISDLSKSNEILRLTRE
ncbi:hypothetical protein RGQ13_19775 [Thalassotalea psychrophila]|uniref:Uncharacterized protein n=1 Tax=Thalassotalea psychrophila TaxID=3065647 RepID=A0ABY9TU48_9GAMM|nr:hypothetical protein RGQ13_19775 [Colwelliaceae bacterium SQ149]